MTSRERISLALSFKEADRIAVTDAPWETTIKRWHSEGLPENSRPEDYFNYELVGFGGDTSFQLPHEILEETEEFVIEKTNNGAVRRNWKNATSTPEVIDCFLKDQKMWEENKYRLEMNPDRINWEEIDKVFKKAREEGKYITYSGIIGYDKTQLILGSEELLVSMAQNPEWVKEMFDRAADLTLEIAEEILGRGYDFDGAFYFDDMGYRNASLFSPKMFKEMNFPAHKRVYDFFRERKKPVILHSCGCVKELIPYLIEAGLTCLQPLEVKAGMDLIELKGKYGDRLAFMGGIDVRKMADPNPSVIEEEIKTKIGCAKKGGGYIYHSDHSVPDSVSFKQYKRVIELINKYGKY